MKQATRKLKDEASCTAQAINGNHGVTKPYFDIVVIAASMGGVQVLRQLLSELRPDLPAPIVIVQHRTSDRPWNLDTVLRGQSAWKVKYADEGERLRKGVVYIAAHDQHLIVDSTFRLRHTDHRRIRHVRPSANPLFTSAAGVFGSRTLAIVLTGGDSDATDGVQSIRAKHGIVIAQDRASSAVFSMPESAIATGCVDFVIPSDDLPDAITQLVLTGKYQPKTAARKRRCTSLS